MKVSQTSSVMQYRPRTLDNLVINQEFGESLKKLVSPIPALSLILTNSQGRMHVMAWPDLCLNDFCLCCAKVSSGDCPHLLFYGPPGAGKKTLIIGLLRQIYGPAVEKVLILCACCLMPLYRLVPQNLAPAHLSMCSHVYLQIRKSMLITPFSSAIRASFAYLAFCLADQGGDKAMENCIAQPQHRDRADHGSKQLPC